MSDLISAGYALARIERRLKKLARGQDEIRRLLRQQGESLMAKIDDLIQDVTDEKTLIDGVVTLIDGLKEQLKQQGLDAAKVDAAFAQVEANKARLAKALTDNTPAGSAQPAQP